MPQTETNRDIVRRAFEAWRDGTSAITDIFAPDMVWRIEGHSVASKGYRSARGARRRVGVGVEQNFDAVTAHHGLQVIRGAASTRRASSVRTHHSPSLNSCAQSPVAPYASSKASQ